MGEDQDDLRYYAAFVVMLGSGFRRGEILGLRWRNVRFEHDGWATLFMRRSVSLDSNGRMVLREGKTEKSRREVPVTPDVADVLRAWKAQQERERRLVGSEWRRGVKDRQIEPEDAAFTIETGRLLGHASLATTEKRYARYAPSRLRDQVAKTAGFLSGLSQRPGQDSER